MHSASAVLVACGDEGKLRFICRELRADGHAADGARCAREAAVKARGRPPQVLALDAPTEQLELLRAIRAGEGLGADFNPAAATIVLGTAGGELELVRCFDAGCDDYLAPPTSYEQPHEPEPTRFTPGERVRHHDTDGTRPGRVVRTLDHDGLVEVDFGRHGRTVVATDEIEREAA